MKTHLVIPDTHIVPGYDFKYIKALSRLIIDLKPDVIINLGDMADMESLCSYDRGLKQFEGRRYQKDIQWVREANKILFSEVVKYNKARRKAKKAQYLPMTVITLGNHENRIEKAISAQPFLEKTIGIEDLQYERYFTHIVPYLETITIDGVTYTHCVQNDLSPTIVGGEHHANSLLLKKHCSITVGHSHKLDFKIHTTGTGKKIMALVAGCFFPQDMEYNKMGSKTYWRGICLCKNVRDGEYDLETVSLDTLWRLYGNSY